MTNWIFSERSMYIAHLQFPPIIARTTGITEVAIAHNGILALPVAETTAFSAFV
jgi:hypothetical protein